MNAVAKRMEELNLTDEQVSKMLRKRRFKATSGWIYQIRTDRAEAGKKLARGLAEVLGLSAAQVLGLDRDAAA